MAVEHHYYHYHYYYYYYYYYYYHDDDDDDDNDNGDDDEGRDGRVSVWDLAVERDSDADAAATEGRLGLADIPAQLLFLHEARTPACARSRAHVRARVCGHEYTLSYARMRS